MWIVKTVRCAMIENLICAVIIAALLLSAINVYDDVITGTRRIERMILRMRCYECGIEMNIVTWNGIRYYECPVCGCWEEFDG